MPTILPDLAGPLGLAILATAAAGALLARLRLLVAGLAARARTRAAQHADEPTTNAGRDPIFEALGAAVLLVCFALSWDVLVQLARAAGLDHTLSVTYPLAIDLLAAAAYRAALRLHDAPWHVRRVPMIVTIVFVALSVVGNALHAWAPPGGQLEVPRGVAAAVTAVPPLSGAVIVHLYALVRRWGRPASNTTPAPAAHDQNEERIEEEAAPVEPQSAAGAEQLAETPAIPRPRETTEQTAERLLPHALAAAEHIAATGARINRTAVASAVRAQGHTVNSDVAQALIVRVRAHRDANRQLVNA
ncbi:DUF2637 domain-containing protein [Parafrankia soli]|uniref:DUF2637 domain-containing protein n=1 Tax=Parafrankia soli TaxID=2599596 RepID=UPI0018E3A0DB|nr:DUF2637 domain-containing protein [Parafrankia soli]